MDAVRKMYAYLIHYYDAPLAHLIILCVIMSYTLASVS